MKHENEKLLFSMVKMQLNRHTAIQSNKIQFFLAGLKLQNYQHTLYADSQMEYDDLKQIHHDAK